MPMARRSPGMNACARRRDVDGGEPAEQKPKRDEGVPYMQHQDEPVG